MRRDLAIMGCLLALCAVLAGCGSATRSGSGGRTQTIPLGAFTVEIDATEAGLTTLPLVSPPGSPINLTTLCGAKIVGLTCMTPNGRIAFTSNRDGNNEIYVMNADGSGATRLTTNAADDSHPAWSPDGTKIAFSSDRSGHFNIWVMNADGSGLTNLTNGAGKDMQPAWSPDGRKIAFAREVNLNGDIYTMNADGSGQADLTNTPAVYEWTPAWSPDGRQIAFASTSSNQQILVMNADGSSPINLSHNSANDAQPSWSPDGAKIAFVTDREGRQQVYVMNTDGSYQMNVSNDSFDEVNPAWSPDGTEIAFAQFRGGGAREVCVMNADGSDKTNVTANAADDQQPAWSPVPGVGRVLIGAAGKDGGSNPPFGSSRPLAVVGVVGSQGSGSRPLLGDPGVVEAASVTLPSTAWSSLTADALDYTGGSLVGLQLSAIQLTSINEDQGRGLPTRNWSLSGTPRITGAVVLFDAATGRIVTVIGSANTVITSAGRARVAVRCAGGRIALQGHFAVALDARDPARNRLKAPAEEVLLDAKTGEVLDGR